MLVDLGRSVLAILAINLALGAGCASAPAPLPGEPPRAGDDAVRLAAELPPRGDRCVVSRPGLVAERRLALIRAASQGDWLAWSRKPRVAAYASASATLPDGRRATVTLLRFATPIAGARQALRAALPLRVRFEDERCSLDACDLPIARVLDDRTVRIERRTFPAASGDSPCLRAALDHPSAIEITMEGAGCAERARAAPCWSRRLTFAEREGLVVRHELVMADAEAARNAREALAGVLAPVRAAGWTATALEQRGATVIRVDRALWDDLEIALEDERIEREAYARRRREARLVDAARVDVTRLSAVRQQVRLREARLARVRGEAQMIEARELVTLLDRAFAQHPTELDLAERALRLRLDVLGDPEGAEALASRVRASGVAPREPWDTLLRETRIAALAARPADAEALARAVGALVESAIAPEAIAGAVAQDLAGAYAAGVPYELVESAYVYARTLTARGPRVTSRVGSGAGAPLAALPATLALLAGAPSALSVFVVVRGTPTDGQRALRAEREELATIVRFDALQAGPGFAGSAGSLEGLLHLGALLERALDPGPIVLDVAVVSLADPRRELRIRIEGRLGGGRVQIERADAWTARLAWPRVERYLADPLAAMGTRVFPPAELVIRAESEEEAARLSAVGDAAAGGARCAARGIEIRCAPPPEGDARAALLRIARAALAGGAAAESARER
jgi:hypothetical protein